MILLYLLRMESTRKVELLLYNQTGICNHQKTPNCQLGKHEAKITVYIKPEKLCPVLLCKRKATSYVKKDFVKSCQVIFMFHFCDGVSHCNPTKYHIFCSYKKHDLEQKNVSISTRDCQEVKDYVMEAS